MITKVRFIALACVLVLSLGALNVSAAVDWTDSLDDPASDVKLDFTTSVPGMGMVDIRHVETEVEGTDVNLTLLLSTSYNASATYSIVLKGDGTKEFTFTKMMILGYYATGPDGNMLLNCTGDASSDGKTVFWTLPQADFGLTTKLEIDSASSMLMDMSNMSDIKTYMDTAGSASPPDDEEPTGPMDIKFTYELEKVNRIKQTVVMTFTGDQAKYLRKSLDSNEDGTVTASERDAYIGMLEDAMANESVINITLDGMAQTSQSSSIDRPAAMLGPVNDPGSIPITMSTTILFPEPDEKKKEHEYRYVQGGSGTSGFDNVTNDSVMKFIAPTGWKFAETGWPSTMLPFLSEDGTRFEIEGKDWKGALPAGTNITSFKIVKKTGGGDDSPGAGVVLVVAAAALAALAAVSGRRRLAH